MGSPRITSALAGTAVALLAAIGVSAPATAALIDLTPENWIASVTIDPETVSTATDAPDIAVVDYQVEMNFSCDDFQFPEANCRNLQWAYQYAYLVPGDAETFQYLASDMFQFRSSGIGGGQFEIPKDNLQADTYYLVLTLDHHTSEIPVPNGEFYTNHPDVTAPAGVHPLPDGADDRVTVLSGCSGDCGANGQPVSAPDSYVTAYDLSLTVAAAEGVLANDSDPDGDPLAAQLVTPPSHGDVTLNADGSFTYAPDNGFEGEDQFAYAAFDGAVSSATTTVTITVDPWEDLVGPAVTRLHVKPGRLTVGRDATVTAVVGDSGLGGSAVVDVEINVDGAGWEPMPPKRGVFDSVKATAQAVVPLDTAGQLEICVRGIDAAGNTGPALCTVETVG